MRTVISAAGCVKVYVITERISTKRVCWVRPSLHCLSHIRRYLREDTNTPKTKKSRGYRPLLTSVEYYFVNGSLKTKRYQNVNRVVSGGTACWLWKRTSAYADKNEFHSSGAIDNKSVKDQVMAWHLGRITPTNEDPVNWHICAPPDLKGLIYNLQI